MPVAVAVASLVVIPEGNLRLLLSSPVFLVVIPQRSGGICCSLYPCKKQHIISFATDSTTIVAKEIHPLTNTSSSHPNPLDT
jgi:hypothetical protein